MVSMNHQAWFGDNFATPGTAAQFGPFTTAGGVSRLIRVRGVLGLTAPGVNLAPTAQIRDQVVWGVQAYITGFTPLVLPANLGGYSFLWSELLGGDTADGAAWTPPTNNVGWMVTRVATREWRGQIPVGPAIDIYVTAGAVAAGAAPFAASFTVEVDYSN